MENRRNGMLATDLEELDKDMDLAMLGPEREIATRPTTW